MHLTLFFTYNTSLKTWERVGMLDREIALYRRYVNMGIKVSFITYGTRDRAIYSKRLPGIEILCNSMRLPRHLFAALIPFIHAKTLIHTDLIKSNQLQGSLQALKAATIFSKPFLARSGYMHSEFTAQQKGAHSEFAKKAIEEERKIFSEASWIEVTTPMMSQSIISRHPSAAEKISVIPNYVDTGIFRPETVEKTIDLLFIGRLTPQKNLNALLSAIQGLNLRTVIIGSGSMEQELKARSKELNLDIEWPGNVPNSDLPEYINRSRIFILPSHYEGHPKTMIEAMACGAVIIATDVDGIRQIISHKETGWLCCTDPESIRQAIKEVAASGEIQTRMSGNARAFAVEHYSLDMIARKEFGLMKRIVGCAD